MHMFHHPLHLNYDIEEKSDHYEEERNYAVAHEAPPLIPLSHEREPQVTSFRFPSGIEPSLAAAREPVHLGLTLWPLVVHSWNLPYVHGIALLCHR